LAESDKCDFIQLVDILVGAIGATLNKLITSGAKLYLTQQICNLAGLDRLDIALVESLT